MMLLNKKQKKKPTSVYSRFLTQRRETGQTVKAAAKIQETEQENRERRGKRDDTRVENGRSRATKIMSMYV